MYMYVRYNVRNGDSACGSVNCTQMVGGVKSSMSPCCHILSVYVTEQVSLRMYVSYHDMLFQDDAQDFDALCLAKSYFDLKEYDRAAYFLRGCRSKKAYFLYMYSRYLVGITYNS